MCHPLYRHPQSVGLRGVPPYGAIGLTGHTYHILHIFLQANPVKELHQDVEHRLEPQCLREYKQAINSIKLSR